MSGACTASITGISPRNSRHGRFNCELKPHTEKEPHYNGNFGYWLWRDGVPPITPVLPMVPIGPAELKVSGYSANSILFPIAPVPKPRMTRRDKWLEPPRPRVARYREFADTLRSIADNVQFELPHDGARFVFHVPMPKSWSKKRRREFNGKPCRAKPDIDNLLKAVMDALLPEDCMVWHIAGAEKRWSEKGAIEISVTPLEREEAA